jgi:DNA-binding NarL/FixJ family response regulator
VSPWRTWALRCGGPAGAPPRATGWPRPVELAREHAAHALAHRAYDELVAAGARPRATPVSKLCVAGMAPEGLSSNEIAEAVFVIEKTVEVHLSNSYRKLATRSRSQLACALCLGRP